MAVISIHLGDRVTAQLLGEPKDRVIYLSDNNGSNVFLPGHEHAAAIAARNLAIALLGFAAQIEATAVKGEAAPALITEEAL